MTSSLRVWLAACLILSSVGFEACAFAPKRPLPPPREVCFVGSASCACYDSRFDSAPPGTTPIPCDDPSERIAERLPISRGEGVCYLRPFALCRGYNAYSPTDYDALQEWQSKECRGQ